jgi:6-phosphogluconolactonase
VADPSNRFALACDLGADQVMIYRLDAAKGTLAPHAPAFASVSPGAGARHSAFSPDGKSVYVINELTCTLTAFAWDATAGTLTARETVPLLPSGVTLDASMTAAEVVMHPNGRFVYGSVRGHDSLSVFAVEAKTGKLTFVENVPSGGKVPRCFGIDPTGRWLLCANQKSDSVSIFAINPATGRLTATGQPVPVGAPMCVKFL